MDKQPTPARREEDFEEHYSPRNVAILLGAGATEVAGSS